jgi:hypothetical protein
MLVLKRSENSQRILPRAWLPSRPLKIANPTTSSPRRPQRSKLSCIASVETITPFTLVNFVCIHVLAPLTLTLSLDPAIGSKLGFGSVILHGLATYGFAARAVLSKVGGNVPDALKAFAVRFTSPVKPGGELDMQILRYESEYSLISKTHSKLRCGRLDRALTGPSKCRL